MHVCVHSVTILTLPDTMTGTWDDEKKVGVELAPDFQLLSRFPAAIPAAILLPPLPLLPLPSLLDPEASAARNADNDACDEVTLDEMNDGTSTFNLI